MKYVATTSEHPRSLLLIVIIVMQVLICAVLVGILNVLKPSSAGHEDIERAINSPLPKSAVHVQYNTENGQLRLSFTASPSDSRNFLQKFCKGILHQGYDPFNAINTAEVKNGFIIDMDDYYYYSYSPIASAVQFGNRCWDESHGIVQILLDTSDRVQNLVILDFPGICNDANPPLPCGGIYK